MAADSSGVPLTETQSASSVREATSCRGRSPGRVGLVGCGPLVSHLVSVRRERESVHVHTYVYRVNVYYCMHTVLCIYCVYCAYMY